MEIKSIRLNLLLVWVPSIILFYASSNAEKWVTLNIRTDIPDQIHFNPDQNAIILVDSLAWPVADPVVMSLIPTLSHSFVETDHEIFSTVILLITLIQEGLLSVIRENLCTKYWLTPKSSKLAQEKMWLG